MIKSITARKNFELIYIMVKLFLVSFCLGYIQSVYAFSQNLSPQSTLFINVFTLTIKSILILYFILSLYQHWFNNIGLKKIRSLLKKDEELVEELISIPVTKISISILPGIILGYYVLPLFIYSEILGINWFIKLFVIIIFLYILRWCVVCLAEKSVLTNKRILTVFVVNSKVEEFYYNDAKSVIYDKWFFAKEIKIIVDEKKYINILNFKRMEKINLLLNQYIKVR